MWTVASDAIILFMLLSAYSSPITFPEPHFSWTSSSPTRTNCLPDRFASPLGYSYLGPTLLTYHLRSTMAETKLKGITRIDYEGISTRGWMVRLTRQGKRQQRFFNDREYGSKSKALQAAKRCYSQMVKDSPDIKTTKGRKTDRNTTGRVGVHLVKNVDARWKNAESFAYCASWIDTKGKRRKLSFAWNRYGKRHAWNLACLARELELADRKKVIDRYGPQKLNG